MIKFFITKRLKKLSRENLKTFEPKKLDLRAFNKKNC